MLHCPPLDAPTVNTPVVPPVLNPVASDIVRSIVSSFFIGTCKEYDPFPSENDDEGMDMLRGVPKTGINRSWKGGVPPVQEIGVLSHSEGLFPRLKVKAFAREIKYIKTNKKFRTKEWSGIRINE